MNPKTAANISMISLNFNLRCPSSESQQSITISPPFDSLLRKWHIPCARNPPWIRVNHSALLQFDRISDQGTYASLFPPFFAQCAFYTGRTSHSGCKITHRSSTILSIISNCDLEDRLEVAQWRTKLINPNCSR